MEKPDEEKMTEDSGKQVLHLEEKIQKLRLLVTEREEEAQASQEEVDRLVRRTSERTPSASSDTSSTKPPHDDQSTARHTTQSQILYLTQGRKLDRFKRKPEKSTDPLVEEWVEDAEAAMTSRRLGGVERAAFLMEHLTGQARREILRRGQGVQHDSREILKHSSRCLEMETPYLNSSNVSILLPSKGWRGPNYLLPGISSDL